MRYIGLIVTGVVMGTIIALTVIPIYNINNGPQFKGKIVSISNYSGDHGATYYNLTFSLTPTQPKYVTNINVTCNYFKVGMELPIQRYAWNLSGKWSSNFFMVNSLPMGC